MNDLKIFNSEEFGEIRAVTTDGEPWFVGKDVAIALGYSNPRDAINKHVDDEDKGVAKCDTLGGKQNLTIINESGLYTLIFGSKLESAKRFKHWVTNEILPSIRKNGGYILGQESMTDEELLSKAILVAQNKIAEKDELIKKQKSQIELQKKEITHKEDVIIGLVENIDLATKRQRITQIIRKGAKNNYANRYALLYSEFERKFHCNLDRRIQNCEIKPKIKNKMDYIDRGMNMIPQLYEITCKLFENDVKILQREWETTL